MAKQYREDFRNYDKEAAELIKGLDKSQLYNLYEIVVTQQQRRQTDTRRKELEAVQSVIEKVKGLDRPRLQRLREGYRSEMARGARASDGNTKPNRKKV